MLISFSIANYVKEETSHGLVKDGMHIMDSLAPINCPTRRKAPNQKVNSHANSLASNGKICSNLPNLSSPSNIDKECEHMQVGPMQEKDCIEMITNEVLITILLHLPKLLDKIIKKTQ